jgi:hypothetical protein
MGQETNKSDTPAGGMIADRRLFLTADHRVVEEGDPNAAFQLVAPGGMIEAHEVARLGLELKGDKISQKKPPAAGSVPVAGGAVLSPRGAVEAAVKDRLKADWEGRVDQETDKEMQKLEGMAEDPGKASAIALNRAGAISREALRRRGDAPQDATVDRQSEALESALKDEEEGKSEDGGSESRKASPRRSK